MDAALIILIVFLLLWLGIFLLIRSRRGMADRFTGYRKWVEDSLGDMYVTPGSRNISRAIVLTVIAGGVIGFLIPGKVSEVDNRLSIERAISNNREGEYAEAVLNLESARSIGSPIAHNELGYAYTRLGNYDQAERELQTAVRLLPHYRKAHQNLAELYFILGRYADASFAEARAMESGNFAISEEDIYKLQGTLSDQAGARVFLAVLFALGAYHLPRAGIAFLRWRRRKKYDEQLADGLAMMANGLRAGLSLAQAIEMVAKEAKPPLSEEFEIVLREHRLGSSLGDALNHLAQRMPGNDTKIMVNAINILLESGGNLPERFDSLAATIQERKRVQQKISTMTAEGETQAWILAALPLVLGLVLNYLNHEVFRLMYTTVLGWMLILLIMLMVPVGLYLMLKMVKINI